jgi:hypothetical protein
VYVLGSGVLTFGVGLAALALAPADPARLGWGAAGWTVAAAVGTWAGARLLDAHGREGHRFVVTFFVSMAVRVALYAVGLAAAAFVGFHAIAAYAVGTAVAHATTQGFEWAWFAISTGALPRDERAA